MQCLKKIMRCIKLFISSPQRICSSATPPFVPAGFNIGININAETGQTIWHYHIHVIPRYLSDVEKFKK
ncbi:HIT family protein [Chryseobacterium sp. MP_3.2]|uniref:HIT family protein n=1 Tax=Chryseobacterium sp. MP_3.2 TaxID=3071712 RepID=UPI003FA363C7